MYDWLAAAGNDPRGAATYCREREGGVPLYIAMVPGTTAFVDYTVIEGYDLITVLEVSNLGLDDLGSDK